MEQEHTVQGSLGGAFLVGGGIATVTQVMILLLGAVLPSASLVPSAALTLLGIAGMVLVLSGTYAKLNEVGGFGAAAMFCGLVDAVAGIFVGATTESGGRRVEGMKAVATFVVTIFGSLGLVGTLLGFFLAHAGHPGALATLADNTASPGLMSLLYAFLMGGTISIVGQALLQFTSVPMPAITLIEGICGMLLAVLGILTTVETLCGAGLMCTIVDVGGGMVASGALLAVAGTPARLIAMSATILLVIIMGVVCGHVLVNRIEANQGE